REVGARVVTGPVHARHLVELCSMVKPAALVVLSDRANADLGVVPQIHDALDELDIFVGTVDEDAARRLPLRRNVHRARSFSGLLHEVTAVAGATTPGSVPHDR
ncbi:MAG: MerR family transcriptional regulator, partial [Actinomycetota bacterium]|nr:MerR family transcriptional regulator [Actinomycetota bacterium]